MAAWGYRPQIPIAIGDFADPAKRRDWIETKGMEVIPVVSDSHPETAVDFFVTEPLAFNEECRLADRYKIARGGGGGPAPAAVGGYGDACGYCPTVGFKPLGGLPAKRQ